MSKLLLPLLFLSTFNESPAPAAGTPAPAPAPAPVPPVVVQSSIGDALRLQELERKLAEESRLRVEAEARAKANEDEAKKRQAEVDKAAAANSAQNVALEQIRAEQARMHGLLEQQAKEKAALELAAYRGELIAAYGNQGVGLIPEMVQGADRASLDASAKLAADAYKRVQEQALTAAGVKPGQTPAGVVSAPAPAANNPAVGAPRPLAPAPAPAEPNILDTVADMSPEDYAKNRGNIFGALRNQGQPQGAWTLPQAPLHMRSFGAPPPAPQAAPQVAPAPAPAANSPAAPPQPSGAGPIDHAAAAAAAAAAIAARRGVTA